MRAFHIVLLTVAMIGLGMQELAAGEPAAPANLTYQGVPFDHWLNQFRTELDASQRRESLAALVAFGRNGKADVVVPLILELLDSYNLRVGLMLSDGFDEGVEELQKPLSEGKLPPGFHALGFADVDDLQLFLIANRSLLRLAPRAVPLLVKHLESEGGLTPSRIATMRALAGEAQDEWFRLVPQLVARDGLTAMLTMHFFYEQEFLVDGEKYEECLVKVLDERTSRNHVVIVKALASKNPVGMRKPIRARLQELQQTSKDEKVQAAIKDALARIPRDPDEKSKVVPASVKP